MIFQAFVQTLKKDVAEEKCGNLLNEVRFFPSPQLTEIRQ